MAAPENEAPLLLDLTIDNITPNTIRINNQTKNDRLKYILERLVTHLHDFARETRLSTDEWMTGIMFLIATGQICSDVRNEFILLSDVLGLSLLVDNINHPKPPDCTEGSVLGPFHTHDAPTLPSGASMSSDPAGEAMLALCTVRDPAGQPVAGVTVDIWETDSSGHYDVQHSERGEPSERCVMVTDERGRFCFKGIKPVSYPIPHDGPVGKLLALLGRHCWRPAHVHFMFGKEGWDKLITALYLRGDPYETSDAVFGVKKSLVIDLDKVDKALAEEHDIPEGSWLLKHDFVLVSEEETSRLRDQNAMNALTKLGLRMKMVDHLPVPELD
ncbi:putative hydroxyquinol -dioxygenase protein [Phaeoacremonium minimum UCRPA7]|uniref:Putative hydroxyquinol-dioxygenase protein n=1 Tax=Phaeoacremonium minimum (strain UCR-PA7) TaxID=1286976 RepID=R8BIE5_PHAM7|nr:putative hydroxyquinol -dioxygenase protein [Phaeoacremonium minimum UCRPA7]EON99012.1 putative hydroxyquinol -dioxygenase protein [Phaeoacremonium minimum UCRPA7]